ncbi:MAG: hypothetical protein JJU05_05560 [Verrucomicrobia bacterium]|nr:hypothetical protein [Verrucomicrobiota bacterium]MCH8526675.1 hypothetical protein [Kiritimatiellia bacterium]
MIVEVSDQVIAYVKGLPPAPRRSLRLAIHKLENLQGDIRNLEGRLSNYQRLRVGAHRIIFQPIPSQNGPVIRCLFAQHRSVVYTMVEEILQQ